MTVPSVRLTYIDSYHLPICPWHYRASEVTINSLLEFPQKTSFHPVPCQKSTLNHFYRKWITSSVIMETDREPTLWALLNICHTRGIIMTNIITQQQTGASTSLNKRLMLKYCSWNRKGWKELWKLLKFENYLHTCIKLCTTTSQRRRLRNGKLGGMCLWKVVEKKRKPCSWVNHEMYQGLWRWPSFVFMIGIIFFSCHPMQIANSSEMKTSEMAIFWLLSV